MSKVETRFKGLMVVSFILVLINVVAGAALTFYLDFSVDVAAVIVGTVMLLHGMFLLIRYLYDGLGKKVFSIDLIIAVVGIILGIFTIFFKFESINSIGIVFALHLVANAAEKGYYALKLRSVSDPAYPLLCVLALSLVVMAVLVAINPFKTFVLSTKLAGIFMFVSGVFEGMICKLFFDKAKVLLKMF